MSRFIEPLESRTLLSATVTRAALVADRAALMAEAKAAKATLGSLVASLIRDTRAIQTDLKGQSKATVPLLRTLRVDEAKSRALFTKDLTALIGPAQRTANKSLAQGLASITHSNAALQTKIAADLALLASVATGPLAKLAADLQATAIGADLQAILLAGSANTTLAADVAKLQTDLSAAIGTLSTSTSSFQTALSSIAADVASTPDGPGTVPNVVGTYTGSTTAITGDAAGLISGLQLVISSESPAGTLTGGALAQAGEGSISLTLNGSVDAAGHFIATLTDPNNSANDATLSGQVSGATILGAVQSSGADGGTFTVTKQ